MKKLLVVLIATLASACTQAPPEVQLVNDAAAALGGRDKILAIKTLTIEGEGTNPNLGQNPTPDADLPVWKVTGFKRTIDPANGRMRLEQTRTAQFPFALATVQKQNFGVDGDVGFNVGPDGMATRVAEMVARDRRFEMLHHPVVAVRAALESGAKLGNLHQLGAEQAVDVTTAKGDVLTLAVNATTKLPTRVVSMSYNTNLGDVAIETSFSGYEDVSGLKMPKRLTTKIDKYVQADIDVSKNTIDGAVGDLAAPAQVQATAAPPAIAPVTVDAQPIGKGIWWLAGSGNHRSVVFEFDDHLVLFEVPLNEVRSAAVIAKARSLSTKPLTHVIVSHHHFDHSGGLRVAVAEGLTIITHKGNEEFFKWLVERQHTIVPDALEKNRKPLKIETMDDTLTLKDKSMELQLYYVKGNVHAGTLIMGYVPRDRMLIQADLYDAGWLQHPWGDNYQQNVVDRKLRIDKAVPIHGPIQTYAENVKTMESKKAGTN
jgi:glyoxylase-like metal-dependent hydrolase (beta-lactamase superfamily II)